MNEERLNLGRKIKLLYMKKLSFTEKTQGGTEVVFMSVLHLDIWKSEIDGEFSVLA